MQNVHENFKIAEVVGQSNQIRCAHNHHLFFIVIGLSEDFLCKNIQNRGNRVEEADYFSYRHEH